MSRGLHAGSKFGAVCTLLTALSVFGAAVAAAQQPVSGRVASDSDAPLIQLGPGDSITISVFGQPDMTNTLSIADDGTVAVPLAGSVAVTGLSPAQAGAQIAKAYKDASILVNPQVTVAVAVSRSQRVSVLGNVTSPGRYSIDSNTSLFDLLAQAGGVTENGSDQIELIHKSADGTEQRETLSVKNVSDGRLPLSHSGLKAGDTIFIPNAEKFYISGEVTAPGKFKLETKMTVTEAIARAGGITIRGSERRVEIKRTKTDGTYQTIHPKGTDLIMPNDIIRVKESIF